MSKDLVIFIRVSSVILAKNGSKISVKLAAFNSAAIPTMKSRWWNTEIIDGASRKMDEPWSYPVGMIKLYGMAMLL